jgi:tRNA G37 N-methylase Trm5
MKRYIVMTAAAKMPSSLRFGRYGKVAVVECNPECEHHPKQIHPRHKSVKRIVEVWDRQNIGITDRCAFQRAIAEAEALRS